MTVLIFYVSLIQERHSDTTIRKLLEEKYPKFQWIVLFAGLLSIAIFGMYGPGCSAAEFVYMQF
jgi:alginate O-acetyltransferase complex protein AlgI